MPDMTAAYDRLAGLLARGTFGGYRLDAAGEALIRETRALGDAEGRRRSNGAGFRGFMNKLHGTHARVALVLPAGWRQATVIPESTVYRAGRYVHFLWGHAKIFYAGAGRLDREHHQGDRQLSIAGINRWRMSAEGTCGSRSQPAGRLRTLGYRGRSSCCWCSGMVTARACHAG